MDPIFALNIPKISLAPEELFHLGPLKVTNSNLTMLVVMAAVVIFFAIATRKLVDIPGRRQALIELAVEGLMGFTASTSGSRTLARRIFPLIATLFIFILCANYSGLLPGVGPSIYVKKDVEVTATEAGNLTPDEKNALITKEDGKQYVHDEKVPLFRSPNADLNMTLGMALIVIVVVQALGLRMNARHYLSEFKNPLAFIEVFARILSLSLRLFGNIFGGEVLVTVMYALTFVVVPTLFLGLELFFGAIQALIFSVLTIIYISLAVGGHADAEHAETHEGDAHAHDEPGDSLLQGAA